MKPIIMQDTIHVPDAPAIPGLAFRGFRGDEDYPRMCAVIEGSKVADGIERTTPAEEIKNNYEHLVNSDPYQDMLFAEMNGQVIGYSRVFWNLLSDGPRVYQAFGFLLPEWRRNRIGTAMLRYNEARLVEIAAGHAKDAPCFFQTQAADTEKSAAALLTSHGYGPVRYELNMRRDLNEPFPDAPMPAGVEVRPAKEEHYRNILAASNEAFQDHWGAHLDTWEDWLGWMKSPTFNPELWKVAWADDQIAGMVLNEVNEAENKEYKRRRGYTEGISVRRPWRKKGLARFLLVQSMKMFKEMGMTETALGVDAENLSGALRLYQGVGYREVKRYTIYRKPMK